MNEDELAELLESGRRPGAAGEPARPGAEAVRGLLGDERVWAEPAPGGLDALLAAIESESAGRPPGPDLGRPRSVEPESVAPEPAGPVPAHWARRPGPRRRGLVLAAAAVLVVVAGVVGLLLASGEDGGRDVALSGTELAPDASATAGVEETPSGVSISLDVRGLAPSEPGTYYQAWVKSLDDELVTIGTFHVREGDDTIELWSGVELEDYPLLTVTLQQEGAGQESSGQVVLSGEIAP